MKTCSRCKKQKPFELFPKRKRYGKQCYRSECYPCWSNIVKENAAKIKDKMLAYKGSCCSLCGYSKSKKALEFHHLDPNEKEFSLSRATSFNEKTKKELDKCILVCSNCHREIHE